MPVKITRRAAGTALLSLAAAPAWPQAVPAGETKVLRYAFPVAETGFDPAKLSDLYSRTITRHIFESLCVYDHLMRPTVLIEQRNAGDLLQHLRAIGANHRAPHSLRLAGIEGTLGR